MAFGRPGFDRLRFSAASEGAPGVAAGGGGDFEGPRGGRSEGGGFGAGAGGGGSNWSFLSW